MIRKHFSLVILLSVVFCMFSCLGNTTKFGTFADDKEVTVKKNMKPFTAVVVDGPYDVHFCQSDSSIVKMVGGQNEIKNVKLQNSGEQLYISHKTSLLPTGDNNGVDIYIYSPNLQSVTMSGCGDFTCKQDIDTDTLRVFMNGTGDVEFGNIVCDNFLLIMRGTGDVDVKELQSVSSQIVLYGTGDVEMNERGVAYTSLNLVGCGDADISFKNCGTADCSLTGTGDITLKGDLKKLTKIKRGSGDINVKKLRVIRNKK